MKNILGAMALVAIGAVSLAASANATPASSLAGIGEQASTTSIEKVGFNRHHRRHFFFGYNRFNGFGDSYYFWKRYCFSHPYYWKCNYFGY